MTTTYDDLYPNADDGYEPLPPNEDNVFKASEERECWNCGTPTHWVDFSFEAHLCSPHCSDVKWAEYFRALRDTDHDELTISPED